MSVGDLSSFMQIELSLFFSEIGIALEALLYPRKRINATENLLPFMDSKG